MVTFDINRYKSFSELMVPLQKDKIESAYKKIVSLPDGYEEDASWLESLGGSDDQAILVYGSDLSKHLGMYTKDNASLIGLFGKDFWDSYYEWLCIPKYFAVAVCSYDGAAKHGDGTNWCTRFGAAGDHTEKYLSEGPLFVIYCNSSLETPSGVADGLQIRGGIKRIAQATWYSSGDIREVNDVKNASINKEKRSEMYLECFLDALFEVSFDLRRDWTPPEKNLTSVTKQDVWGQDVIFDQDGDIIVEEGVSFFTVSGDEVIASTPDLVPSILTAPGFYSEFLSNGDIESVRVDMSNPVFEMNRYFDAVRSPFYNDVVVFTGIPSFDPAVAIFSCIFRGYTQDIVSSEMVRDISHVEEDIVLVVEKSGSIYCSPVSIQNMPKYFRKRGITPVGIGFAYIDDDDRSYESGSFMDVTYLGEHSGLLREGFESGGNVRVGCFVWFDSMSGWKIIPKASVLAKKVVRYRYPEFYRWYKYVFIPLIDRYNEEFGSVYRTMNAPKDPYLSGVYINYAYIGGVRHALDNSEFPYSYSTSGEGISFDNLYRMFEEDMPNKIYADWSEQANAVLEFLRDRGVANA